MTDIQRFINYLKEDERADNTISQYRDTMKLFFQRYCEVNEENVRAYKTYLMENFKPKTVNCRLIALKKWADYFSIPLKMPKRMKMHRQLSVENVITPEEFNVLCEGLKKDGNQKGYWLVNYIAKTGVRVSELVRLTKKILENGNTDMLTKAKVRRIYIPKNLIEESKDYFNMVTGNILFPNRFNKQMTSRGVSQLLQNYSKKYGIRKEVMHPHGFRHFFAKEFLRKGGDLSLLSDLLGHEDLGTTAIYTRQSSEEMAEQLSKLMA